MATFYSRKLGVKRVATAVAIAFICALLVVHLTREHPLSVKQGSEFQKAQIDDFCEQHGLSDQEYTLPSHSREVRHFNRHLLVDKHKSTIFCFVPKAGCTNLKIVFLANQQLIPNAQSMTRKEMLRNHGLEQRISNASIKQFKPETQVEMIKNYFKFIMVRNPLERLVSAYRDKIAGTQLHSLDDTIPELNYMRKAIFEYNHPKEYAEWVEHVLAHGKTTVNISLRSFSDFINYWSTEPETLCENEHFKPVYQLCHVCRVKYDFYANFKNFEKEANVLQEKISATSNLLFGSYYPNKGKKPSTDKRFREYYGELSRTQKREVLRILSVELDFYYHLFPEEKDCHKDILSVEDDLPVSSV